MAGTVRGRWCVSAAHAGHPQIIEQDFLAVDLPYMPARVSLGNPPYGKRSKLAIDFVNRCALLGDAVAFILPPSFRKWSVQCHIDSCLALVYDGDVPSQQYRQPDGSVVLDHRRIFQIWQRGGSPNLRLRRAPPTEHPDFRMWQYNHTGRAMKVFNADFHFAVPRQGYCDYTRRETTKDKCERSTQWIMFKAHSPEALARLLSLDFVKLAERNTSTPGFGKADVVALYDECQVSAQPVASRLAFE